jgi:hypothetical protein
MIPRADGPRGVTAQKQPQTLGLFDLPKGLTFGPPAHAVWKS